MDCLSFYWVVFYRFYIWCFFLAKKANNNKMIPGPDFVWWSAADWFWDFQDWFSHLETYGRTVWGRCQSSPLIFLWIHLLVKKSLNVKKMIHFWTREIHQTYDKIEKKFKTILINFRYWLIDSFFCVDLVFERKGKFCEPPYLSDNYSVEKYAEKTEHIIFWVLSLMSKLFLNFKLWLMWKYKIPKFYTIRLQKYRDLKVR